MKTKYLIEVSNWCRVIRKLFREAGIFLDFVTSADAGVATVKNCHYDIVFMDGTFLLSGEDDDKEILSDVQGVDAIRAIRSFSLIPIIMISASDQLKEKGLAAGANGAVEKSNMQGWLAEAKKLIQPQ